MKKYQIVIKAVGINVVGEVLNNYPTREDISLALKDFGNNHDVNNLEPAQDNSLYSLYIKQV